MKTEVKPGSPEDRILTAIIEAKEASGEVITPKIKKEITSTFMMGYTSGFAVSGSASLIAFCGLEEVRRQDMLTEEEMIKKLINDVNGVALTSWRE